MSLRLSPFLLLAWLAVTAPAALAQVPVDNPGAPSDENHKTESWQQMDTLVSTIQSAEKDLAALKLEQQRTKDELDRKKLSDQIAQQSNEIDSLKLSFEMLATSVDLRLFYQQKDSAAFDWKSELEAVFQPIVVELKRFTERPRKIERLRSEQAYYQTRLPMADAALQNIKSLQNEAPSPALKKQIAVLEERWQKRRNEMDKRLQLVEFELQEALNPTSTTGPTIWESLSELLSGRGLSLLLALSAFAVVYAFMRYLAGLYDRHAARRWQARRTLSSRFIVLAMHAVSVFAGLLGMMAVLYVRGDWLLLGLLLILLVAVAFAAKNSLPHYINQTRLLLNIGSVREGGRVIHNGLPWKVVSLNVFSTLQNPLLRGGTLQLPLSQMTELVSRRHADDEPWFPSRENDFVLLEDNTFGRVLIQTPEIVQLFTAGAVKTYPVQAYIEQKPKNLTQQGFVIGFKFGLDYAHQAQITTDIRARLENYIEPRLRNEAIGACLQEFAVHFDEAATSSLDLMIVARFGGDAAEHYVSLRRLLQRLAVDACNANQWSIPFNQLSVHFATPLPSPAAATSPASS